MTGVRLCDYGSKFTISNESIFQITGCCWKEATFQLVSDKPGIIAYSCEDHYVQSVASQLLGEWTYAWSDEHWEPLE